MAPPSLEAHDPDAIAAAHEQVEPFEELAAAAQRAEPFRVEDDVAGSRRGREPEAYFFGDRPHVLGVVEAVELFEHLAPALRLLRLLPRDVFADEVLGLVDESLLPLGELALSFQVRFARDGVIGVAKRVDAEASHLACPVLLKPSRPEVEVDIAGAVLDRCPERPAVLGHQAEQPRAGDLCPRSAAVVRAHQLVEMIEAQVRLAPDVAEFEAGVVVACVLVVDEPDPLTVVDHVGR